MFLLLLSLLGLSLQFNLDTQSVQILKSDNGLFGYSVAMQAKSADEKLILVGSPNADTNVSGVVEGGAVFKCNIPRLDEVSSEPVECTDIIEEFSDGGNKYYWDQGEPDILAENKSHQFLGVSIAATDKYVAVCGHRYEHRYWLRSLKEDLPRQLIGRCLVLPSDEFETLRDFQPCDNAEDSGYMTYGYCQAGMSVALRDDTVVLGAPGTDRALGRSYQYDLTDYSDEPVAMEKIPTPQNVPTTDKYIGYSSVICDMDGDPEWNGYEMIFGGPRGEMYSGEVRIYSSMTEGEAASLLTPFLNEIEVNWVYNFPGEQMGSYFGHSLACADVNGDGFEDVIVGAPWYTHYTDFDIFADTGRIYVMYGSAYLDDMDKLENPVKITGEQANSAFGYSLANGGDMNDDSFIDVFVGAPYYDDGEGAVFLYLGSPDGLQPQYSQIIKPSTLNVLDNIRTFGWSISPGRDMDGNGYPDIAIGAYQSGHVAFIRSKSIIDVVPTLGFKFTKFNDTHKITSLQICLKYEEREGRDPLLIDEIPIKLSIAVDPEYFRLSFSASEQVLTWEPPTMNVATTGSPFCTANQAISYDNSTGNVQPLPVVMTALIDDPKLTSLSLNQEIIKREGATELTIQSMCHPNTGICTADLTVELDPRVSFAESTLYPTVVFGYVKSFVQKVTVSNIGTDQYNYVYNAAVKVTFNTDLMAFSSVSVEESNVNCNMNDTLGYLVCHLLDDGPLNKEKVRSQTFGIEFDISNITQVTKVHIRAEAIVDDPTIDENDGNNAALKYVEVKELADLLINGGASRFKVAFNNQYTIVNRAIGSPDVDIKHEYSVELSEDALQPQVRGVSVKIYWPQKVPMTDIHIVPLYNISMRIPHGVDVFCTPSLQELYPEAVGDKGDSLQVSDEFELPNTDRDDAKIPSNLDCANNKKGCQLISCEIDEIKRGAAFTNGFKISLFAKIHEHNLYGSPGINITSSAMISHVANDMELPLKRSALAKTVLYPSVRKSTNWIWVIIGAVIGGLIFLFLLILCLWKCGFFKRKQPPTIKADKVDEQIDMTVYGQ